MFLFFLFLFFFTRSFFFFFFFFSSRRRHTRWPRDWSSDVCSSDLATVALGLVASAIPESYGGFGDEPSALTGAIVLEELGYGDLSIALHALAPRSEERRVGKECRSRWSTEQ